MCYTQTPTACSGPLLGGAAAVPATAAARPASETETIQKPERQTELLQRNGDTRTP
jgi:hypothetical protein